MQLHARILQELQRCRSILLTGVGGGFDLYSSIPLYFALKDMGKQVYLGSYTLTTLSDSRIQGELLDENCTIVTKETTSPAENYYFPEKFLVDWLREKHNIETIVYTFHRVGPRQVAKSFQKIITTHKIDAIICIDGGNDSLMKGDEDGLGTPVEDMISLLAASSQNIRYSYLVCLGVTVDYFHGVQDNDNWLTYAEALREGGFRGIIALDQSQSVVQYYMDLVNYANEVMPNYMSIVQNSIVSAITGEFGNKHRTPRTKGSELRISPVMSQYWCFSLQFIVNRLLYADLIKNCDTLRDVAGIIAKFRKDRSKIPSKHHTDVENELQERLKSQKRD